MQAGRCTALGWDGRAYWARVEGPPDWILGDGAATAARLCLELHGCRVQKLRPDDDFETLADGTVVRTVRFRPSTASKPPATPFRRDLP